MKNLALWVVAVGVVFLVGSEVERRSQPLPTPSVKRPSITIIVLEKSPTYEEMDGVEVEPTPIPGVDRL